MIDRGATTIWETWKESDTTFSNCHPMFGTVTEWFYRCLGGIRPDPANPGFKEFVLAPRVPDGLESISSAYHSPYGEIVSNWKRSPQKAILFEMKIPKGSTAQVSLLLEPSQKLTITRKTGGFKPENIKGLSSGEFRLEEGEYTIMVSS
jgi:alpha-L-rhamnosidase